MSRLRIVLAVLVALLVVGMQRQALVHEVDHLRARVALGHDVVLQKAASGDCLQCALLASGSHAVPDAPDAFVVAREDGRDARAPRVAPPRPSRPSYYQAQAPPIVL